MNAPKFTARYNPTISRTVQIPHGSGRRSTSGADGKTRRPVNNRKITHASAANIAATTNMMKSERKMSRISLDPIACMFWSYPQALDQVSVTN